MKNKEKPKYHIAQNVAFMFRCAWASQRTVPFVMILAALLAVGQNLCQLYVAPKILSKVETAAPFGELLLTIGLYTGLNMLLSALVTYFEESRQPGEIDVRVEILMRLNRKICTTSFPNTRDPVREKLRQEALRNTEGNHKAAEHIWRTLSDMLAALLGFGIYLVLLSSLDGVLLATVLATSVLSFLAARKANGWELAHREEFQACDKETGYIVSLSHKNSIAKDIRIFGLAPWLRELNAKAIRTWEVLRDRSEQAQLWANIADVVLTFLRNGIAYAYLLTMAVRQDLRAAEFLLYFSAVSGLTNWIVSILNQFAVLHRESISLSQVQEYLNLPEQFRFTGGQPIPVADAYELQLENVTFRYPGTEKNIFENLNLTIAPGEKLAIVGLNGAGKTTLILLLCGFYDPDEGRVLLNGTDIREFNREEYYKLFSAVFQEFSLMDVTIAQQVAQQAGNIDIDRVWDCLEKAGLTEFVNSLPRGLDTHMGREVYLDGILLSGGQTQRLVLARALYKNGAILVLDEPTAALDPIAENDIYMKYNEMSAGKTALFISHRLASTRFCDRIVYIADGGIAEEGTHEALLAKNGAYANLFEVQSRYYREGGDKDEES